METEQSFPRGPGEYCYLDQLSGNRGDPLLMEQLPGVGGGGVEGQPLEEPEDRQSMIDFQLDELLHSLEAEQSPLERQFNLPFFGTSSATYTLPTETTTTQSHKVEKSGGKMKVNRKVKLKDPTGRPSWKKPANYTSDGSDIVSSDSNNVSPSGVSQYSPQGGASELGSSQCSPADIRSPQQFSPAAGGLSPSQCSNYSPEGDSIKHETKQNGHQVAGLHTELNMAASAQDTTSPSVSPAPGDLRSVSPAPSDLTSSDMAPADPASMATDSVPTTTDSVSQHPLPPCRICGDKASGFHYGANTCEACKVCTQ